MTRIILSVAVLLVSVCPSFAQSVQTPPPAPAAVAAEPDYPIVRLGVLSYVQYDDELKNRDNFNVFDVTRLYLNVNGQLSRNVRFRFTPDVRRSTDGSLAGTLVVRDGQYGSYRKVA